ncbi:DsbC family protein [Acinetobacter larvae]|uniref:Thiol:disulfide interchange protein n=1 Tax=Acinetobacter larvae TaxID=1789224 RepID=A0A1B2M3M4_9GAMM|nr:DsbC family protein [Acinetobacter larvae]AOA59788.1 thiol:disulfide interchange protein [Acinetobacter larvae]
MVAKGVFASLLLASSMMLHADVDSVQHKLTQNYPNVKITDLKTTPVKGLYSGILDQQVIYLDEEAQHILVGSMIRLQDQRNLSKDLVASTRAGSNTQMSAVKIDVKSLDLSDALKTVRGNGRHQLIVFSDPNCPYCKTLDNNLSQLKDVTIYTFLYPIKHQSVIPSQQVWCSPNRQYAWQQLIAKGVIPTASADCPNPVARNLALGKRLAIQGTPAIIFADGHVVMGAYSATEIQNIWQQLGL